MAIQVMLFYHRFINPRYKSMVLYTQCLRYNICSAWFLDIRISTCFYVCLVCVSIIIIIIILLYSCSIFLCMCLLMICMRPCMCLK